MGLNAGLNTKYGVPDATRPAVLFFGDMDDSGSEHLVEAKCKDDGMLPVRGRSCSSSAMPVIKRNFGTFRDFARADLPEIYSEERLDSALRLEANLLESGVWLNVSEPGRPAFEFRPFPRIAQVSPSYDATIRDFDGDGLADLFLAQNHDHREPETGLWRGGVGQVLLGRGDGTFVPMSPRESGILLRGDATNVESVDVDGDGRPDLVATQNDDRVRVFLDRGDAGD